MNHKKTRLLIIFSSGFFLLLDQWLKWQALHAWANPRLLGPNFGWQPFLNRGAAFNLPLFNGLIIIISAPILVLLGYLAFKEMKKEMFSLIWLAALTLLLAGGISNLIDRLIYRQVVDYFLLGTAIINLGDAMIAAGLILFLLKSKKRRLEGS